MEWIWGCMTLSVKAGLGTFFWFILVMAATIALSAIGYAFISGIKMPKEQEKTAADWECEQEGELKTLLQEIEKDLDDEDN